MLNLVSFQRHSASRQDVNVGEIRGQGMLLCFAIALCLAAHPHLGLRHDGVLYLGQLLSHVHPMALGTDFFFAHGSQDQYSLFSALLVRAVNTFGLPALGFSISLFSQVALLLGAGRLITRYLSVLPLWLPLSALALGSRFYGGHWVLSFGEDFVTARSVAEPLALWSLVFVLERRYLLAGLMLAGALLLHPLQALPATVVVGGCVMQQHRRLRWLPLLALVPLALAWSGLKPFSRLFDSYDELWWGLVYERNGLVLPHLWNPVEWCQVALDLWLVGAMAKRLPKPMAELCRGVFASALLLLLISTIAVGLFHNVLLTQLQLWRVLWLLRLVAMILAPGAIWHFWRSGGPHNKLFAIAWLAAMLATGASWQAAWAPVLWAALCLALARTRRPLSTPVWAFAWLFSGGLLLLVTADSAFRELLQIAPETVGGERLWLEARAVVAQPLVGTAVMFAVYYLNLGASGSKRWIGWALSLSLLTPAAYFWDQRTAWTRILEHGVTDKHPFEQHIGQEAQVYWHGQAAGAWALLHRASYFSIHQGAGLLFNRGTALDYGERHQVFNESLRSADRCLELADLVKDSEMAAQCFHLADAELLSFCERGRNLDFIIADSISAFRPVMRWIWQRPSGPPKEFYLYDCKSLDKISGTIGESR
ncbi:hypothetical protein RQP53_17135 [Paucibacter sp. APW11]|uniref:Uncharacterized protein n=1 Tax=Roseateles aquae TaxID=3077235 RepID=A0ABU3PEI6_9BURK|nr:hypothetical protein [Paucibacter sp. APW11]MDT9001005.1 hypothetical protein [Paucibacter sp. APW11]